MNTDTPKTAHVEERTDRHGRYWAIYRGETMLAYCENSTRAQTIVDALNNAARPDTPTSQPVHITARGIPGMDLKFARQHISDMKRMQLFKAPEVRDLMFAVENMLDYLETSAAAAEFDKERQP